MLVVLFHYKLGTALIPLQSGSTHSFSPRIKIGKPAENSNQGKELKSFLSHHRQRRPNEK